MKTYFLLSDTVQTTLIITLGGIITVILGFIFPVLTRIFNKQIEIREGQLQTHKEMDGMKTELVNTTAELNKLLGNKEGRDELKKEIKEDKVASNSQTEINRQDIEKLKETPAAGTPVIITKNLDK